MLRVGVSGLGSIGCRHARLLAAREDVEVHAFDPIGADPRRIESVGPLASLTERWEDLLAAGLDALVVASPDTEHAPQVTAAVDAGVPVLVEKPLAESSVTAAALARRVADRATPVLVGYVLRHHVLMGHTQQLVATGAIGEPVSVHASVSAAETLQRARNRFDTDVDYRLVYDYSHEWDYLQWLFGPIVRCSAAARTLETAGPVQRPSTIDALVEFESRLTGTVHLDYVRSDAGRWLVVVGADGTLRIDFRSGAVERVGAGPPTVVDGATLRDSAFDAQLDHFIEVVGGTSPPAVTVADGVSALAVADAVRDACETGSWTTVERSR